MNATNPNKRYGAFTKDGEAIVGTVDWISGLALIQGDSWQVGEDGTVQFEWAGETKMFWDACHTETYDGVAVYQTENGHEVSEDQIILMEVDKDGKPLIGGERPTFTPGRQTPFADGKVEKNICSALLMLCDMIDVLGAHRLPADELRRLRENCNTMVTAMGFNADHLNAGNKGVADAETDRLSAT